MRGRLFGERFEVEAEAGAGGMATVLRARDLETGSGVALKVLLAGGDAERFEREARVLASLEHEGIVRYVAHGVSGEGDGPCWLAMEWLEGEPLDRRLSAGRLSVAESLELVRRVADALGAAHARGIVHRDLKPSNLLLEGGELGRVRVIDFGIALGEVVGPRRTTAGFVVGTPEYMAPEQVRGDRRIDARADVFALGCVLHECLTGAPPFAGEQVAAVLAKVLFMEAPSVCELEPDVPEALGELLARMLSKDPSARPADGGAVREELDAIRLSGSPARPSRPSISLGAGEQRHVSVVMLGKGGGSVGTVAGLDPISVVVRSFGAQAEGMIDGSVVLVLPVAGAASDQAARAAACALAVRAVAHGAPMALATGRAEIGGPHPIGEAIDRAAALLRRLEGAEPPPIGIDEVTSGLLDERFLRGEQGGEATLVGRREIDAVRTLCGKPTPCVGREGPIALLESVFEECVRESVARAVLVTAGPGMGKSRLRYELLVRLRARGGEMAVWLARGEPVGAGSPFGLAAQAIRRTAGIREGELPSLRQQKLRARARRHVGATERERVARFLGEMIGAPFADDGDVALRSARRDPILMGDQIRRAWEDLVDAECAAHPLLIVLDDLHWGDRPTVELADAALRLFSERPLMVLAFARPEVDEMFPELWKERDAQRVRLPGLPRRAAESLVRTVLGETASGERVAHLVETAAGNAFYLEELIRAESEGRGGDAELPPTVVAMVQSRLDALPTESRRILRAASVFGQAFWMAGLHALLGRHSRTAETKRLVDELVQDELLAYRPASRFLGQTELAFRHALVREGAYAMLTEADRTLGHQLAARWLQSAGETSAIVIAEHLERGGEPAEAALAYRRAAAEALEGNDLAAAIERASRGVALGARGQPLGELLLIQAEAHRWRGSQAEAERCAFDALSTLPVGSDLWSDAARAAARSGIALGHNEQLVALAAELRRHLDGPDTGSGFLSAGAIAAGCLMGIGEFGKGDALLTAIEAAAAGRALEPAARARLSTARATRALHEGRTAEMLELMIRSVEAYGQAHDARAACWAGVNLGYAFGEVGAHGEAERALEESLDVARRLGLHNVVALAQQNLGWVLAKVGRYERARRLVAESLDAFRQQGNRRTQGCSLAYLGAIDAETGRAEEAERELRTALELLESAPPLRAEALAFLARHLSRAGRVDEATARTREAMGVLASLGKLEEGEALVRLVHVEVLDAAGERAEAKRALAEARDRLLVRAEAIGEPRWRRCFLEDVAENRRTLALAAEWLDGEA